ncbi:MAG: heavy metal-responsive transcriptional regulator [Acidimicrobiales bacterium]
MTITVAGLAGRAGVSADTVRYYERIGLLEAAPRNSSGYRIYDEAAVERIRFVRSGQRLGLRLDEVRELLEIRDRGLCPCGHADELIERRITGLDDEIVHLTKMRDELQTMVSARAVGGSCVQTLMHSDSAPDQSAHKHAEIKTLHERGARHGK